MNVSHSALSDLNQKLQVTCFCQKPNTIGSVKPVDREFACKKLIELQLRPNQSPRQTLSTDGSNFS